MALFSSHRERRLWLWTLAVVAAIYSTLGLAGILAGTLGGNGRLGLAFGLGMLLVGAALVTRGLSVRPGGAEVAAGLGVAAAYLLLFVRVSAPAERTHLIEYGVVGLLIHEALAERARRGRRVPAPPALALTATVALGLLDETLQAFLPRRVFDPRDILFNALAGAMAVGSGLVLAWARRRKKVLPGAS